VQESGSHRVLVPKPGAERRKSPRSIPMLMLQRVQEASIYFEEILSGLLSNLS